MSDLNMVKTAVVGASGYTGTELLRILLQHPAADLKCVTSRQYAGERIGDHFPRFRGAAGADLTFSQPDIDGIVGSGATVAFLAVPHGLASEYAIPLLEKGLKVIDLSADFRVHDPVVYEEFYGDAHPAPDFLSEAIYGLPEIRPDAIAQARLIASPGCYPTSMLIPLIPLLAEGLIDPTSIHIFSMSGVSGAGRAAKIPLLFAECSGSLRAYSVPKHRHLSEVEQELSEAAGEKVTISFTPHLVPVIAGITTTIYAQPVSGVSKEQVEAAYQKAYGDSYFVRLLGEDGCPDSKNVVGTNFIDVGWAHDPRTGRFVLMSSEDNLGKGAASQAVQSFNLMNGLPETTGLTSF